MASSATFRLAKARQQNVTMQAELALDTDLIGRELDVCWCFYDDSIPSRISRTRTVRLTVH